MYSPGSELNKSPNYYSLSEFIHKGLLSPFQKKTLTAKLKTNLRAEYRRRIEIMLLADAGHSQAQICSTLSCSHETARYWIHIAQSGAAHKWQDIPIGRPRTVNEIYLDRLEELVGQSPRESGYAFKRWTASWLSKHLAKELGIEISERHVNRLLKKRGLSTRSAKAKDLCSQEAASTSNIVIRNLQGKKLSSVANFSPFNLI